MGEAQEMDAHLAATVESTIAQSPNRQRIRALADKLTGLSDELGHEKQARADAVELKLKVLDDKLLRAQIAEEEKLKPLNEQIARYVEELSAERLAREKKLREEAEERHEKEVADEIIRIADTVDQ